MGFNYQHGDLLNKSNACLELRDGDQAEFLSRRLEEYEETLHVMYQRLKETRHHQEACLILVSLQHPSM